MKEITYYIKKGAVSTENKLFLIIAFLFIYLFIFICLFIRFKNTGQVGKGTVNLWG